VRRRDLLADEESLTQPLVEMRTSALGVADSGQLGVERARSCRRTRCAASSLSGWSTANSSARPSSSVGRRRCLDSRGRRHTAAARGWPQLPSRTAPPRCPRGGRQVAAAGRCWPQTPPAVAFCDEQRQRRRQQLSGHPATLGSAPTGSPSASTHRRSTGPAGPTLPMSLVRQTEPAIRLPWTTTQLKGQLRRTRYSHGASNITAGLSTPTASVTSAWIVPEALAARLLDAAAHLAA
jgi:hypothetical protein